MANPDVLSSGLMLRLQTITSPAKLNVYPRWPDTILFPAAIIRRGISEPEQTFGSPTLTKYNFELYLFASLAPGYDEAQKNLAPYLATSTTGTVLMAIDADRTLGGRAITTFVKDSREAEQYDFGDISAAGTVFDLEVWAS